MDNTEFDNRIESLIKVTAQKVYNYYLDSALSDCSCTDVGNYISWKIEDNYSEFVDWIDFEEQDKDLWDYICENDDVLREEVSIKIANTAEELIDSNDWYEEDCSVGNYY